MTTPSVSSALQTAENLWQGGKIPGASLPNIGAVGRGEMARPPSLPARQLASPVHFNLGWQGLPACCQLDAGCIEQSGGLAASRLQFMALKRVDAAAGGQAKSRAFPLFGRPIWFKWCHVAKWRPGTAPWLAGAVLARRQPIVFPILFGLASFSSVLHSWDRFGIAKCSVV